MSRSYLTHVWDFLKVLLLCLHVFHQLFSPFQEDALGSRLPHFPYSKWTLNIFFTALIYSAIGWDSSAAGYTFILSEFSSLPEHVSAPVSPLPLLHSPHYHLKENIIRSQDSPFTSCMEKSGQNRYGCIICEFQLILRN